MTFQKWKNTPEGQESFDKAYERADGTQGIYADDLMWSDYQSSDDWEKPKGLILLGPEGKPEELEMLQGILTTILERAEWAIDDFQLKDAKKEIALAKDRILRLGETAKALNKYNIKQIEG